MMSVSASVVAICTRNRPVDLARCLAAVSESSYKARSIFVVDSSDGEETKRVCDSFRISGEPLSYFRCAPGLTLQRNFLIDKLPPTTKVVHFIDDDAIVDQGYFEKIEEIFERDTFIVGVGGRIRNLPNHKPKLLDRIFRADSNRQGAVLRSGVNILNFSGYEREVHWLSGCSMSFRYDTFQKCLFDEARSGNGIGEDVDFCLKAQQHGKLIWTPEATQLHIQSPINRLSHKANRKKVLQHRLKLASQNLGEVKKLSVYLTFGYESARSNLKPIVKRIIGRK